MKKLIILSAFIIALPCLYYGLGSVYKTEFYQAAMDYDAEQSGLVKKSIKISAGEMVYYENKQPITKPSVVLLHGFTASKENWLKFSRPFKDDYHVVIVDFMGHGESSKNLDLTFSLDNQVLWLDELITRLKIDKIHIAGNSMGGAISAMYATQYPQKILTATLIAPAGVHINPSVMTEFWEKGENPLIASDVEDFYKVMDYALEKTPFIPWPVIQSLAEQAINSKPIYEKVFEDIKPALDSDFAPVLKQIKAPTLVLWGEQDQIISYKDSEFFAENISDVKVKIWPGVGHVPMMEIPEVSAALMIEHIVVHTSI